MSLTSWIKLICLLVWPYKFNYTALRSHKSVHKWVLVRPLLDRLCVYLPKCVLYVSDVHAQIGVWCGQCLYKPVQTGMAQWHIMMLTIYSCACSIHTSICLSVCIQYMYNTVCCIYIHTGYNAYPTFAWCIEIWSLMIRAFGTYKNLMVTIWHLS